MPDNPTTNVEYVRAVAGSLVSLMVPLKDAHTASNHELLVGATRDAIVEMGVLNGIEDDQIAAGILHGCIQSHLNGQDPAEETSTYARVLPLYLREKTFMLYASYLIQNRFGELDDVADRLLTRSGWLLQIPQEWQHSSVASLVAMWRRII